MRYLQLRFQQKLQNHLEYRDDIRTIDIEYFFTKAQETYVDTMYEKYKGEESLRKRLSGVYMEHGIPRGTGIILNGVGNPYYRAHRHNGEVWRLPGNVRYVLDEYAEVGTNHVPIKPIDATYYNKQAKNPFKKPCNNLIWRLDRGTDRDGCLLHELIRPNSSMNIHSYGIMYIKTPANVKLTVADDADIVPFEVSSEYHDEILDIALDFALATYRISGAFRPENTTPSGK